MSGTKAGGSKTAQKLIEKYGKDYFKNMGRKGGKVCVPKGFSMNRELAREAGRKGGSHATYNPKVYEA